MLIVQILCYILFAWLHKYFVTCFRFVRKERTSVIYERILEESKESAVRTAISLKVNQRGHRNDSFVLVRFVSLRRANEACNKHPVRTIVEAETHFVLLYALRSWPTSSSNGIRGM